MKRYAIPAFVALTVVFLAPAQITFSALPNARAQASDLEKASGNALNLSSGTAIVGRLSEGLYAEKCKIGDVVEAQITRDVTEGHQTLLKKGAHVTGRIAKLNTASNSAEPYGVGIVFDNLALKNGDPISLHVEIRAIAPPQNAGLNPITDLPFSPGNSRVNANQGVVEALSRKARDPSVFPV